MVKVKSMQIRRMQKELLIKENTNYFQNCHASTVVKLSNDDLLVAFFAGTKEGTGDTAIWLSRKTKNGWEEPKRVVFGVGIPHWNPSLFYQNNKIWLFYKTGFDVHSWITRYVTSEDNAETWSVSKELVPLDPSPRGPVKNKVILLSNGAWLAPGSVEEKRSWDAFTDYSSNQGLTWKKSDLVKFNHQLGTPLEERNLWEGLVGNALWENDLSKVSNWDGIIQPSLWESQEGLVHMMCRSTRGYIYRSDSIDFGKTWCESYPISLPNNNSGIDVVKMENGILALVYNPVSGNWSARTPLTISFSEDNGITWTDHFHLETESGEFSYPAIITEGNELFITYTVNRNNIAFSHLKVSN
jgi:predicted neuraminidase